MRLSLPSYEQIPGGRAFAALSRRVRTLLIAAVLFVVLFALLLTLHVPYVVLSPGPTYNTLGTDPVTDSTIIVIKGKKPAATTGHLNLTTVSITSRPITALQALTAWLRGDEVVVPRAAVYPPGQTDEQVQQQNTQDFISSQDNAAAAALCELHYPRGFGVLKVDSGGLSGGVLRAGDLFRTVDGKPATSLHALVSVLGKEQPGTTVPVTVTRAGKPTEVEVKLGSAPKGRSGAGLDGVSYGQGCLAPFTIDLGLANQIGGPSAGLMFALGIMDKVGTVDLTGGQFIAGTGEIDSKGNVSPIGGIQLKMIAARDAGATIFLAPEGNCEDVNGAIPAGLQIIKVSTLHGAVRDLERVQQGQSVPSC